MPGKYIEKYDQVPVTKEKRELYLWFVHCVLLICACRLVDWAELITLDLSQYEQLGGKESLVKQLEHAVRHVGKSFGLLPTPRPRSIQDLLPSIKCLHQTQNLLNIIGSNRWLWPRNRFLLCEELQHQPRRNRQSICSGPRVLCVATWREAQVPQRQWSRERRI